MNKPRFIIITGCAGIGKTTLGKQLAKELKYTFIDKDTLTMSFVDYIQDSTDRESDIYCNKIKPIEYDTTFSVCKENLQLGNSVILVIPFISQIRDYSNWQKIKNKFNFENIDVRFIWLNHNENIEYEHLIKRNAIRDKNKLTNWQEYCKGLKNIKPDEKFNAYCIDIEKYDINDIIIKLK